MTLQTYFLGLVWAVLSGVASAVVNALMGRMLGVDYSWKQLGLAALTAGVIAAASYLRTPPGTTPGTPSGGGTSGSGNTGTTPNSRMGGPLGGFRRQTITALCGLLLAVPLLSLDGCARRNPGESDAAFKLRQRAVLLGTVAVSLEALSDGTTILVDAGAITTAAGIELLEYDSDAARAWIQLRPLLDGSAPLPPDITGKFNAILSLLERFQTAGLLHIKNPQAREWFAFSIELARTSITAVDSFTRTGTVPRSVMMDMAAIKNRKDVMASDPDTTIPVWILTLIRTAIVAEGKIHNLNLFSTAAEVWNYSGALIQHLLEVNSERTGMWRSKP